MINIGLESQVVGTPLYKPYRYVLPQRVWFLHCYRLKMGIESAHFGLELRIVLEGTRVVYECICCFNSK